MQVTYVDHMGSDLSVVNAARVSFNKKSEMQDGKLSERDAKLIRFLAREGHWTPFGHTSVTLHVKAPIFIARQLGKHQVGLVWNEVSRRYVDDEPEFFEPVWRSRPTDGIKQGSGEEVGEACQLDWSVGHRNVLRAALSEYNDMIEAGVAPEQARMVLPQSMMTEWYWTGSVAAFARVYALRIDKHAQREAQEIAGQIADVIGPLFPESWEALTDIHG